MIRARLPKGGKITVFGDSVPKGLYLDGGKVARVQKSAVRLISEALGTEIENFSAFGQTLNKCMEKGHVDRWIQEASKGDILVFSLGGNDCDYDWAEVAADPLAPHAPKTPYAEFVRLLGSAASKLKHAGFTPVFTSLAPIDSARYFKNVICNKADGEQVMRFFRGDVTNISRHQECYNDAVCKAALACGGVFLDFRSPLLLLPDYLGCLSDDGIHPNQRGHEEIASALLRSFPLLRAASPAG